MCVWGGGGDFWKVLSHGVVEENLLRWSNQLVYSFVQLNGNDRTTPHRSDETPMWAGPVVDCLVHEGSVGSRYLRLAAWFCGVTVPQTFSLVLRGHGAF